ncbi:Anaphase-promoting complex subunit 1 [Phytophthora pseudosyringae]|uniref:Anaphase-promoting complex subunit 1 n=1 Tax=Phytophthora pseudosyringae TaxID=221518 RepID=A0A8T1WIF7_9STRA|nr:Anaphase-promoting complex subunit 1 [Phytophthora pseudosyringae]
MAADAEDAAPSIRVTCAGVRANPRRSQPADSGRVFFSESQYASSPFLVRVTFDSVSFVHRGTHVVERRFVFPGRVLHAVLADFSRETLNSTATPQNGSAERRRARKTARKPRAHPHLCVLVRSDCLNVYTAAGEVFEVALPFQANRLFPVEGWGLLLQRSPAAPIPSTASKRPRDAAAVALARKNRRASTSNRGDGDRYKYSSGEKGVPARPGYFTLRHPLDEVKPVALRAVGGVAGKSEEKFLSDSALEAVDVLENAVSPVLVAFHRWEQRFYVFRMNVVEKLKSCVMPEVRVVDGPTWTRYRARSDLEELRVRIEPDWMATMLWKSPRVGPATSKPMFLSPIISPSVLTASPVPPSPITTNTSSTSSGNVTKVAFIVSGVDGRPLLCIMDKDAGTLLLKPMSQQESTTATLDEGGSEIGGIRILHCRDAVPIRQQDHAGSREGGKGRDFEGSTDIVVLEKDGTLMLYRAHHPICRLVLRGVGQDDIANEAVNESGTGKMRLVGNLQLNYIDRAYAYEIVFPDLCGSSSGKVWRCEHPLRIVGSPLLQQVFSVLDCIIPPVELCAFKAQVACSAQQKVQNSAENDFFADGGLEWQSLSECIMGLLPKQTESKDGIMPSAANGEEEMMAAVPSSSSFDALCQSEFHDMYQYEHAMLFATMELPETESLMFKARGDRSNNPSGIQSNSNHGYLGMVGYMKTIFAGLHLLCEELKLSITLFQQRLHLAKLLFDTALRLGLDHFVAYYKEDNCILIRQGLLTEESSGARFHSKTKGGGLLRFTTYGCVPDLIMWLQDKMTAKSHTLEDFPTLFDNPEQQQLSSDGLFQHPENPLRRTRALCRVYELIFPRSEDSASQLPTAQSNAFKLIVYLTQDPIGSALSLEDLPVGLSVPIVQTICQVKHHPPPYITEDICAFVGREDLSIASAENLADHFDYSESQQQHDPATKTGDSSNQTEDGSRDDCDGLEDIISRSQPLFPADQRMKEVARLLRSSRPLCLKLEKTPDLSDLDYAQQQQARLLLLCKRSMALSVARGMVTLGSFDVSTAQMQIWRLHIPALPLQGRKPPTNAIVELDLSGYAKELTYWPQFHNGCATGLRLPAHDLSGVINRHWIKYHRPSVNDIPAGTTGGRQAAATQSADTAGRNLEEAYAAHAGLLLGIGLRGHLKCLSMADVYNYLSLSNEFVTVAIMLGMASTAAHCRNKRKQQAAATKPHTRKNESHSPTSGNEDSDMAPLEADHFFSGIPELSSSDKTPLVGTGLELALERSVSKMLCLHVPSLLPPPFGGFSVPASTQTAALLGLGILYQGSGYRLMTELLLTEIARSPSSPQFVGSNSNAGLSTASFDQLEGYALAAGMALGLVVLGRGQTTTGDPGLADLKLEEKLHKYIVGGAQQYRDANAAGSCLYRGRRWQAFGSGGNGFNSAVNGSAAGNVTPNSNTGGSPGAGRDTKHSNDRSGARSGGEHVNTGVTACASALALAFMYMQTDNRAVSAQLAVPDTLILLDYVRPDILLARTLAKNLVMWSEISPAMEWIDRHEVPAQLLQAYKSIQSHGSDASGDANRVEFPSGSPSHSDLHSICEAYANIVAGACLSIGLRFAGTGNTAARGTLRKYVLHFRELRTKASTSSIIRGSSNVVAAATERVTVERCLAVCAQALALVDAGTGHVKTLALLRSITLRQRVDAAMSYGNHMALSMAIGLLFLGGGRATVARSKEAIAALVVSLYPMPPMNTADNKYHLQAFRHLYVLAVDTSRLVETVDVNTKVTCAVQVRVNLLPGENGSVDETEPSYRVLRSPCLLPDITTIKRLVISDPEFYPIEILTSSSSDERTPSETGNVRTANSLRLELLRNKNVVFLKHRQRKNFGGFADFTEELEQLHDGQVGRHLGGNNHDDRLRRLFRFYFTRSVSGDDDDCEDGDDEVDQLDVADWGSSWWASQLSQRALEHVKEEAQLLMPPYLNALHALFRLQQVPQLASATEVEDLNLLSKYCRLQVPFLENSSDSRSDEVHSEIESRPGIMEKTPSLSEFGVWLSNQTEEALGALWHRTSLDITSLASARVQLLVGATPPASPTKRAQSVVDAFFVSVLVRYFAGPSVSSLPSVGQPIPADKHWKAKFQRVLAACSQAQLGTKSPARFQLPAFLEQDELTEAEKTFWLQLVSFFLFSN